MSKDTPISKSDALDTAIFHNQPGMLRYYSGCSDEAPAAFGIKIATFDSCAPYEEIGAMMLVSNRSKNHKQTQHLLMHTRIKTRADQSVTE